MAGKIKGSALVDASVTEVQLSANINANLALAASVYNQANAAYAQANGATGLAQTAYNQGSLAYNVANTAGNTVRVSVNSSSTLSNKQLNFVNTATITITVSDAGDGNANIELISTSTDINTINFLLTQANAAYDQANNAYNKANTFDALAVTVNTTFTSINANILLANTRANDAYILAASGFNLASNAQNQAAAAYNQANLAYTTAVNVGSSSFANTSNALSQANLAITLANLAYVAANAAANTVRISANGGSTLSAKQLNFVNTANIQFSITDAGNGNANINIFASAGNFVRVNNEITSNATYYPLLTTTTTGNVLNSNVSTTKLTYIPSSGQLNATTFNSLSDVRHKENIETLLNALVMLESMRGVRFTWKENGNPSLGIIAQELSNIAPELVHTEPAGGIMSVNYSGISAILIEAMKSMNSEIKELRAEIEKLKNVSVQG